MIETPADIYRNVPFVDYCDWDAMNQSTLKEGTRSMFHLKDAIDHPKPQTPAMHIGHVLHSMWLEPGQTTYEPKLNGSTTEGKAQKAAAEASGVELVTTKEMDDIRPMLAMLKQKRTACDLWDGADRELSIVWIDDDTGVKCKARVDIAREADGVLADLKTTADDPQSFLYRSVTKFKYYMQAAFYVDGMAAAAGERFEHFTFICVEKSSPHDVFFQKLDIDSLEVGRILYKRLLREYASAKARDLWPGYTDGVTTIRLPEYMFEDPDSVRYVEVF